MPYAFADPHNIINGNHLRLRRRVIRRGPDLPRFSARRVGFRPVIAVFFTSVFFEKR